MSADGLAAAREMSQLRRQHLQQQQHHQYQLHLQNQQLQKEHLQNQQLRNEFQQLWNELGAEEQRLAPSEQQSQQRLAALGQLLAASE